MTTTCPQCGATLNDEITCKQMFDSFLLLEYTHPEYGEVHMLTVACYMIQHGQYSDEALVWIEGQLRAYLEGASLEQLRQRAAQDASPQNRIWKVTRQKDALPLPTIHWKKTIADIFWDYQSAAEYRARIKEWAATTLEQMQPLLKYRERWSQR